MLYLDEEMAHTFWDTELLHEDIDKAMQDTEKVLGKEYIHRSSWKMR